MTTSRSAALYSPQLLALAVELADYPFDNETPLSGHARSRTCGSEVWISCRRDEQGAVASLGLKVVACAVGQASAALFARTVPGLGIAEIGTLHHEIESWLEGGESGSIPVGMELLEGARPHKGRHEAILLPWRAALDALSKAEPPR